MRQRGDHPVSRRRKIDDPARIMVSANSPSHRSGPWINVGDKAKARHHSLLAAHSQGRWPLAGAVAGGFDFSSTFGVELSMSVGRAPRRLSKIYLNHVTAVCASVPVARVHCRSRSSIRRQAQLSPNTIDHCKSSPLFGVRRSSRLPSPRDTRRP